MIIGGSLAGQWYAAGFETFVDDSRWQIIPKSEAYTNVWADPTNAFWSTAPTSPCNEWKRQSQSHLHRLQIGSIRMRFRFQFDLENIISTSKQVFERQTNRPDTMIRSPDNQPSARQPERTLWHHYVRRAIAMSSQSPIPCRSRLRRKFYVPNCSAFDPNTTPHFTAGWQHGDGSDHRHYYATDQ